MYVCMYGRKEGWMDGCMYAYKWRKTHVCMHASWHRNFLWASSAIGRSTHIWQCKMHAWVIRLETLNMRHHNLPPPQMAPYFHSYYTWIGADWARLVRLSTVWTMLLPGRETHNKVLGPAANVMLASSRSHTSRSHKLYAKPLTSKTPAAPTDNASTNRSTSLHRCVDQGPCVPSAALNKGPGHPYR